MRQGKRLGFRHWVTPRALLLHLALLVIAAGCLTAAWWQVQRAMQGNTLSYLYSIEWPVFVVVAGIGWFQMVRDTPEDIEERRRFHVQMRAASAQVVARTLPRSALAIEVGSTESGGRVLAAGEERVALTDGGSDGGSAGAMRARGERRDAAVALRSDASLLPPEILDDVRPDEVPAEDMTAYNRYLALLTVRGRAKTWRNPRGV